eukprot:3833814-Rhodomonas_salina.1
MMLAGPSTLQCACVHVRFNGLQPTVHVRFNGLQPTVPNGKTALEPIPRNLLGPFCTENAHSCL